MRCVLLYLSQGQCFDVSKTELAIDLYLNMTKKSYMRNKVVFNYVFGCVHAHAREYVNAHTSAAALKVYERVSDDEITRHSEPPSVGAGKGLMVLCEGSTHS